MGYKADTMKNILEMSKAGVLVVTIAMALCASAAVALYALSMLIAVLK